MASRELSHAWRVEASPDTVFAHLADPASYVGMTPFVIEVADIVASADSDGAPVIAYTAVERFRVGSIPVWHNRIRVTMRPDKANHRIVQDVVSPGGVRLHSVAALQASDGGTLVQEKISLTMPGLLTGFVSKQARAAQLYRGAELARRFSRAAS